MIISPAYKISGPSPSLHEYAIRRYDDNNHSLSKRDFWTYATPLYDYIINHPKIKFQFNLNDWSQEQYEVLFSMLCTCKNVDII